MADRELQNYIVVLNELHVALKSSGFQEGKVLSVKITSSI